MITPFSLQAPRCRLLLLPPIRAGPILHWNLHSRPRNQARPTEINPERKEMIKPQKRGDSHTPFLSNYDIFIAANRKGGIGKTTLLILLIACALMRDAIVRAFEIDRQSRLQRMYPGGMVQQVDLPNTEQLIDDELAEGRALALVYNALRSSRDEGLIFVDIGANYDERVAKALLRARLGKAIAAAGRRVCVLVPLDAASDTITAAASAVQQFTTALPGADVVFVQRQAQLIIDTSPNALISDAAKKAYVDVIAPLHSHERTLNIGQMRRRMHQAFAAIAKNPLDFMDADPELLGAAASDSGGDKLENEVAGDEVRSYFEEFMGQVDLEAQRVLGFRTNATTPEIQAEKRETPSRSP